MKFKDDYFKDEKDHSYYCSITNYEDIDVIGAACCAPEDYDVESEKTGYIIAGARARIKVIKTLISKEKAKLAGFKQLYHSTNRSKHYNKRGYMERMLRRQIHITQATIDGLKETLNSSREALQKFIADKDAFYKKLRKHREGQKKENIID